VCNIQIKVKVLDGGATVPINTVLLNMSEFLDRIYYTISNKTITISILPVCLYVIAKWYRESAEVGRVTLRIEDQKIREYQAEVKIGFEVQRGES
jgi:hypothetical protein